MITSYVSDSPEALAAIADPQPKHVWVHGSVTYIFTGVHREPYLPTQDEQDRAAARAYAKLTALRSMTPAQVQSWVSANVTTLAQAQDAIATLAIALSILARGL